LTVNLYFSGTATNGVDVITIPSQVTIPANDSIINVPISPIADNLIEGNELLKIYIANGNCGATTANYADSISINIVDQVRATVAAQSTSCASNTGQLVVSVPTGAGFGPYTYSLNAGTFQSSNTFSGLPMGNFVITVRDSLGCTFNSTMAVPVNNTLKVTANNDTSICKGANFTANTTTNGGAGVSYFWSPSMNLSSATINNPVITGVNTTSYIVTATQGPCIAKDTFVLTVFPAPQVSAGPDISIINGDVVQLQAQSVAGTYLWSPSTGLSATNVLNPMANPTTTTTYTLQLTTPQGCISTDDVTVTVLECIQPMQAFSPNGDGINDVWLVTNPQCLRQARVQVFNRYGSLVYESGDYKNNWDGTYSGKAVADGTYYFVISYTLINGKINYLRGNVTILR
jgi:gliding motility-associated-like protein